MKHIYQEEAPTFDGKRQSLKVLNQCIDIKNPSIFRYSRALAEAAGGEDQPAILATSFGIAFLVIQVLEIER